MLKRLCYWFRNRLTDRSPLVNPETGGQLMPRVKGVRKLTPELGYLIHQLELEML